MTSKELKEIIAQGENAKVDFKREWYKSASKNELNSEFIKDIFALTNGDKFSINKTAYLIIGITNNSKSFYNFDTSKIPHSLERLKKDLLDILNNHAQPEFLALDVEWVELDEGQNILVLSVPPHGRLISLSKDLHGLDKKGTIYYRQGESIRVASLEVIKDFEKAFEKDKKTKNFYKIALFISIGLLIFLFSYQEYSNSNTNTYLKDVDNLALVEYINNLPKEMENIDKQLQQELANNELKRNPDLARDQEVSDDAFYLMTLEYETSEFTKEAYLKLAKFYKKEYFGGKSSSEFLEDYIENIRTNRQIAYKLSKLIENFVKDISDKNKKIDYSNWKSRWEKAVKMKDLKDEY